MGALSAVGGVVYALFQHDLKRLLAFHSIENVGIIVLGLGACLLLRARGAGEWAALALAAALLHTLNHAVFKALLFLGAGSFERGVGSLQLDRLGGLLRRMPWTGGAFLVGAMAIAGLPPLNGFASEWLTLQALLHVPAYGGIGDGVAGAIALGALAATAALAVLCFVKVVGLVLLGPPRRDAVAAAVEAPVSMRAGVVVLGGACVVLGLAPGLLVGLLSGLAPWPAAAPPTAFGLRLPGTGSLPTLGIAVALVAFASTFALMRGRRVAAPAPTWACGQLVRAAAALDECRVHQAAAARARNGAAPAAGDRLARRRAGLCRRWSTAAGCRICSTSVSTGPSSPARSAPPITLASCRPAGWAPMSPT